jgi:hypothetical protein
MDNVQRPREERSLGELFSELTQEITTLVRQEAKLAKAEMSEKLTHVCKDLTFVAAGGAVAYAGLLAIVAAIVIMLADAGLPWWASALLVGVVVAGIGAFLVSKGLNALKHEDLVPRQTIASLKEDVHGSQRIRHRAT